MQKHILIVDDEALIRKELSNFLTLKGYVAIEADSGEAALALLRQYTPSVVLLDLRLGDMSGLSVMKKIKAYAPHTECIVLTGYASQASAIEAINVGAYSYVQKPYDFEQLLLTIRRAIEKRETEEALHESQRFLATLIANLPGMAYRCRNDRNWTMEFVSQGCVDLTGYQPDDLLLNRRIAYARLIHPDDQERVWEQIQIALRWRHSFELEYRLLTASGQELWVWERGRGILSAEGELLALEGFVTNITERKRAEETLQKSHDDLEIRIRERTEELEKAKIAAEAANRAKSEFLANMSHELRTPLNAISGYAQILSQHDGLAPKHREQAEVIHRSGQHLLILINDILDLAKIEAGKFELDPNEFYLPGMLQNLADMTRLQADQKGLSFHYEVDDQIPYTVYGDEKRLRQILLNLLGNAVKFTLKGNVTLRVMVKGEGRKAQGTRKEEDTSRPGPFALRLTFEVEDTGIGIPEELRTEIFQPFHQIRHKQFAMEGAGLGLSLSQRLAHTMGSELQVDSVPGQGSLFRLTLELPVIIAHLEGNVKPAKKAKMPQNSQIVLPPEKELRQLLQLANRGTPAGILEWIGHIEQMNSIYRPFAEEIRGLARQFQIDEICERIEQQLSNT